MIASDGIWGTYVDDGRVGLGKQPSRKLHLKYLNRSVCD